MSAASPPRYYVRVELMKRCCGFCSLRFDLLGGPGTLGFLIIFGRDLVLELMIVLR